MTHSRTDSGLRDETAVTSVLVIQFRFLGDLVLGVSLLDNLAMQFPDARLSILSDAGNAALLAMRPHVDFIPYRRKRRGGRNPFSALGGWLAAWRTVRSRRVDVLIDISNSRSGAIFASLSGVARRIGYRPYKWIPHWSYTEYAPEWGRGRHTVDRLLSPLDTLGLSVVRREPRLEASQSTQRSVDRLLEDRGLRAEQFVAFHLGARVAGRQWPIENFAHVADEIWSRYGLRVAVVGGPDEREVAAAFCGLCHSSPVDLAGQFTPEQLAAVLARCRFFLGNDSGPMHVAAASGAKVVALFGLQSPERWAPLGEGHVIVRPSMPCPCLYPDRCRPPDPQATFCVHRLAIDDVLNAVARMMRG